MKRIISIIFWVRAQILRRGIPNRSYYLATRSVKPLSRRFGFDRGTPIDRFWIESFLATYKQDIKGVVLEIGDRRYTKQFGGKSVTRSDILDLDPKNKQATIHGDLTSIPAIRDNSYDCIVLTHVLGIVPEYEKAVAECYRILKKGGVLLVTASCFSPVQSHSPAFWRFTPKGIEFALLKCFQKKKISVSGYGNVLSGQCFWVGLSQEELTVEELSYHDPEYPCIVAARSVKT